MQFLQVELKMSFYVDYGRIATFRFAVASVITDETKMGAMLVP
jgi:hypothetical protein